MKGPNVRMRTAALLAALLAAVALAACGSSGDSSSTGSASTGSAASGDLTKVTMVQEWPVADGFWIPWILGKQKGFYADEGIDLQIVAPPTVADTMKYLGTGRADVAFTTIMDVVFAREQGAPVTAIGRYFTDNNWGLFTKAGDKITAADLKGKTIGIYSDAWTKAQLQMVLKSAGLTMDDVKTVSAADDTVPLLLRDKVDAITGITNAEGTEIQTAGKQTGEFLPARENGAPNSPIQIFAANSDWLKQNPELAKKFMAATQKSIAYAIAHPEEGVDAYFKEYSKAYDRDFVAQQWKDTIPLLTKDDKGSYFTMTDEMWTPLLDAVKANDIVKKVEPTSSYYTNDAVS
jgi:putative hydroxymethylpyrimidine transport system substrate-binding protein